MTVIMALKKDSEIWVGADSRLTAGDFPIDCPAEHDSKIVLMDHAVIGAAGDLTMRNLMELFVSKGPKETEFNDKLDVIAFFLRFRKFLKRHAGLGEPEQNQVQNLHNTGWLLATKNKIFEIDQDGAVLEVPQFTVIGSGTTTARAILEYMTKYQPNLSPSKTMRRAHEMATKHNLSCGGIQIQINVTKFLS